MDYRVITNLALLLFLGVADNQMMAALLPALVDSLHLRLTAAGMLVVVYSLAAALASFASGALSDHYGRRPFLQGGIVVFALASLFASRSAGFNELLVARALTGFAAGTLSTCSVAFAGDWFDYRVRGRAVGLISSAYFAGPILGVPLAAQMADRYGWRSAFLCFALMAFAGALTTLGLPRERQRLEAQASASRMKNTARAFRSFFERRDTLAAALIAFLVSGGLVGFLTYIGQWLSGSFGLSTRSIGWVFMLGGLASLAGAPLGGWISDRWGKKMVALVSNVVLAVAVVLVPWFPWGVFLLCLFALTSLGAAFRQGPLTALITELVRQEQRGAFIALRNICSQLGIATSAFVGGILYERYGYAAVTTFCAALTFLVVVLLAALIEEPQAAEEQA